MRTVDSTRLSAPQTWRAILEVAQALVLAIIISVFLNLFVIQVTEVRQRSMELTLEQDDRVLVSKIDYRLGSPERGDIIVFNSPAPQATIPFVKRVIALGGDTVDLRGGSVFVNDQLFVVPQAHGGTLPQFSAITYPFTVPDGHVFVLGDNRQSSSDSRTFASVPIGNIIGKVILRFWPVDRLVFFEW
jgi:signal peptidase I